MPAAPRSGPDPLDLLKPAGGGGAIALAVSGGSDSMALLRLAAAWRDRPPATVLTVDHGLRPEAAAEARQVAEWSAAAGLPHVTLPWQGEKPSSGIQARARQARYDLMSRWCRDNGAAVLLTAHTRDDQAETVLMRLARTSSLDSLAGIRRETLWAGVRLFRPLLGWSRSGLRAWLASLGQPWIDDPSNSDTRYERVRLRSVLPLLAEAGIGAEPLAEIARQAGEASDALWAVARAWQAEHVTPAPQGFGTVPAAAFGRLPGLVQARVAALLVRRFGGGGEVDPHEAEGLCRWFGGGGGPRRTLGGALFARRKAVVIAGREPGRIAAAALTVPPGGEAVWDGRFRVTAPAGSRIVAAGTVPGLPRDRAVPAFVHAALPAVVTENFAAELPHLGAGAAGTCGIGALFLN